MSLREKIHKIFGPYGPRLNCPASCKAMTIQILQVIKEEMPKKKKLPLYEKLQKMETSKKWELIYKQEGFNQAVELMEEKLNGSH